MVTTSILLVINKVCGYLDNIRYVDIISVADMYNNIKAECAFCGTWRAGGKCLRKQVLKYSHRHSIGIHG